MKEQGFKPVLQNALANSSNPTEMKQMIQSGFKSEEAVKEEAKEEIQVQAQNREGEDEPQIADAVKESINRDSQTRQGEEQ